MCRYKLKEMRSSGEFFSPVVRLPIFLLTFVRFVLLYFLLFLFVDFPSFLFFFLCYCTTSFTEVQSTGISYKTPWVKAGLSLPSPHPLGGGRPSCGGGVFFADVRFRGRGGNFACGWGVWGGVIRLCVGGGGGGVGGPTEISER